MLRIKQQLFTLYFLLNLTSCSKDNSNPVTTDSNENSDTTALFSSNSSNSNDETTESSSTIIGDGVPSVFTKIYGASDIYIEDSNVIIKVNGIPDHKSPYFNTSNNMYEDYNGSNLNFNLNPNKITGFDFTYKIPLNPKKSDKSNPTALGSIGVSINGVSFFNQYAGPNNQPLTNEINSFDQYNGHPQPQGVYHCLLYTSDAADD